ncbi:hypothetical protein [Kutzneria kofuensis]|uniref:Copper chaperone CopZ n=1 Tax=Kutzneria kofuensis TaxID=103725 RepID=A0A7W9KEF9_9PSEU|nr:hypothetical protein [Kutzneria kofuensis]MBB5891046.1 copper chaperone CopZ [Kutzneria kofuensis]
MTTTIRVAVALLGGALLAGCGAAPSAAPTTGTSSAAAPTQAGPDTNTPEGRAEADSIKSENLMADCMKAAGFQYVPHPQHYTQSAGNVAGKDPATVPYDVLKTYRQKYGYGSNYASDVYPNDPNVVPPYTPAANPNNAIRDALDPARKQAYDLAYDGGAREQFESGSKKPDIRTGGCVAKVNQQIGNTGGPKTTTDPAAEAAAAQAQQQFQTDPTVLSAAQAYGSCLQQHGYTVPSTKPGVIERTLEQLVQQEHTDHPVADKKQGLSKEIQTSLDDLECGKAYEAAAKPFVEKLLQVGVG